MNERNIVKALAKYFSRQGYYCRPFVRIHPREIDLVLLDPQSLALIAIEVKKSAWRAVIPQAATNRLYSHFSFIAVPGPVARRIPPEPLDALGLGLISFADERRVMEIMVEKTGTLSTRVNRTFKNRLYREFRGIGDDLLHD